MLAILCLVNMAYLWGNTVDIDIDFQTTFDPRAIDNRIVRASMVKDGSLKPHPCGVYFQSMPKDEETGLAAIPYKQAADRGFFKIDCLHLSLLDGITSKQQVRELAATEPDWSLFTDPMIVSQLFQLRKHAPLICQLAPKSVMELADCVALIRPGVQHLIDKYVQADAQARADMRPLIYAQTDHGYGYKKPHAVSYALTILVQLNHMTKMREC